MDGPHFSFQHLFGNLFQQPAGLKGNLQKLILTFFIKGSTGLTIFQGKQGIGIFKPSFLGGKKTLPNVLTCCVQATFKPMGKHI